MSPGHSVTQLPARQTAWWPSHGWPGQASLQAPGGSAGPSAAWHEHPQTSTRTQSVSTRQPACADAGALGRQPGRKRARPRIEAAMRMEPRTSGPGQRSTRPRVVTASRSCHHGRRRGGRRRAALRRPCCRRSGAARGRGLRGTSTRRHRRGRSRHRHGSLPVQTRARSGGNLVGGRRGRGSRGQRAWNLERMGPWNDLSRTRSRMRAFRLRCGRGWCDRGLRIGRSHHGRSAQVEIAAQHLHQLLGHIGDRLLCLGMHHQPAIARQSDPGRHRVALDAD